MKKLLAKPVLLLLVLILLYLVFLFLGTYAISAYPIARQKDFFLSRTSAIAQEYQQGVDETLQRTKGANTRILIYDTDGNCLLHVSPTNALSGDKVRISLDKYMPVVLAGKVIFRPAIVDETLRASSASYNDIMTVAGAPIRDGNTIVGAVFVIKNLMDLPEAITGYCVYFTVFYWLSLAVILLNVRKSRKLDELRQNYVANVTHALKTPVASIKALSETLCDGVEPDPDRQRVYYGMILQEANRQDHMIRDALELSKLQSNGMDFTKAKLLAAEVFEPVLRKYATLCDCMDITLHISENISALPPLYTNAACVRQILEILLDNAIKFVPEGGNIWVETVHTKKHTTICVRDDGIGIEKGALPQVFDRFFKGSHDFNASGSGLGLAIAKEITAGLKERIWVESQPGKGAAFFFTIHLK